MPEPTAPPRQWPDSDVKFVGEHMQEGAATTLWAAEVCGPSILAAARLIAGTFKAGGKLLLCGNGGSAADCQHMAAEFTSRLSGDFPRPGLPAMALTTDTSFLTAFSNDFGFAGVFARQVQALGKPGDVLLGISTSGQSGNVIRAIELAKDMGIQVVVLTGARPAVSCHGTTCCTELADVAICVPSDNPQHIQETHLVIEHILCHLVERDVFGEHGARSWGIEG